MKTKGDLSKHGHVSQSHFRGWKRELLEGGHRVPFFIRWPEKIREGDVCETTIGLTDIFPTIAELLSVELDKNTAEDGVSFLSAITGKKRPVSFHEAIVHHHANGSFAIRKGDFKLIIEGPKTPSELLEDSNKAEFLLYDVKNDIRENNDLTGCHPELVSEMYEILKNYVKDGRSVSIAVGLSQRQ